MHRAGLGSIALVIALSSGAQAFHAGSQFDKPAGAGGGGGLFYTGAPREKKWSCVACHIDAPQTIRLGFKSMPEALLTGGVYVPKQAYALQASLIGEHEGLASPQSNYNSLAIVAVDSKGDVAGKFSGYAPEDFYDGGTALVSAGKKVGVTIWSFTWTAPPAMTGKVTFYVCIVDGNGANSAPGVTLTDPFGDDVVCGSVSANENAVGFREPFSRRRDTETMGADGHATRTATHARRLHWDERRRFDHARPERAAGSAESSASADGGDRSSGRRHDDAGGASRHVRRPRE
jgi:hypothetical protein